MRYLYLFSVAFIAVLFTTPGRAQVSGTDVFLKGRFVEVGIGHLGYYGSDTAAPAGFHYHCPSCPPVGRIGFVADPAMDGWTVGTPPQMGDYFLPGSPFEGWELQVDGKRCQAFNHGASSVFAYSGGMDTCTGANTSYTTSGSYVIGTWEGMVDSITVLQETSLDTNSLYFSVKVTLTNTASTPRNNIYYLRWILITMHHGHLQADNSKPSIHRPPVDRYHYCFCHWPEFNRSIPGAGHHRYRGYLPYLLPLVPQRYHKPCADVQPNVQRFVDVCTGLYRYGRRCACTRAVLPAPGAVDSAATVLTAALLYICCIRLILQRSTTSMHFLAAL